MDLKSTSSVYMYVYVYVFVCMYVVKAQEVVAKVCDDQSIFKFVVNLKFIAQYIDSSSVYLS